MNNKDIYKGICKNHKGICKHRKCIRCVPSIDKVIKNLEDCEIKNKYICEIKNNEEETKMIIDNR
tara:strand:+ start:2736 stop:2930 length:195 start_codon:yes stop_codon:yes gene_type:complete